jgi:hypothetical protein
MVPLCIFFGLPEAQSDEPLRIVLINQADHVYEAWLLLQDWQYFVRHPRCSFLFSSRLHVAFHNARIHIGFSFRS